MAKRYTAVYLPADSIDKSARGFKSKKAAWDYIATHLCTSCAESLFLGYEIYSDGKKDFKADVKHPGDTACGCEWLVTTEEDYDKSESIHDLFEAGGFVTFDPKKIGEKF